MKKSMEKYGSLALLAKLSAEDMRDRLSNKTKVQLAYVRMFQ